MRHASFVSTAPLLSRTPVCSPFWCFDRAARRRHSAHADPPSHRTASQRRIARSPLQPALHRVGHEHPATVRTDGQRIHPAPFPFPFAADAQHAPTRRSHHTRAHRTDTTPATCNVHTRTAAHRSLPLPHPPAGVLSLSLRPAAAPLPSPRVPKSSARRRTPPPAAAHRPLPWRRSKSCTRRQWRLWACSCTCPCRCTSPQPHQQQADSSRRRRSSRPSRPPPRRPPSTLISPTRTPCSPSRRSNIHRRNISRRYHTRPSPRRRSSPSAFRMAIRIRSVRPALCCSRRHRRPHTSPPAHITRWDK